MSTLPWINRELHALKLKESEDFAGALHHFEDLINDVQSNHHQASYLLKLRNFYGECLEGLHRFDEAEAYYRLTMTGWDRQEGDDATEGRALIRLLLATTVLRQCDNDEFDVDSLTKRATDSISLLQSALDSETDSVVAIMAKLTEGFSTLAHP